MAFSVSNISCIFEIKMRKLTYDEPEILKLYSEGFSLKDISEKVNRHIGGIKRVLTNNNIKVRGREYYCRINKFNEDYFEEIDTKDKAYFLGFLYADGNIYLKRNRVQITLQNKDAYILLELGKRINYTGKLYIDRVKYSKLILDSKKMSQDLINKGCIPNKSLILKFPTEGQVPKELQRHFLRGFFDGDGGIQNRGSGYTVYFTSTEQFCISISNIFKPLGIQCGNWRKRYRDRENSAGSMSHYENRKNNKIYHYLYDESDNLYLIRKFKKFKDDIME